MESCGLFILSLEEPLFFIVWSLCSLFRDLSPATSIPMGSQTRNIWTIFMAFHHIWFRRHARDALEKIHWSIATRITHWSCWMHSRMTNNLITDWTVVFLSHLELHTGANFFFEQVNLNDIIWKWITRRFVKRSPFYFTMLKSLVLEKVQLYTKYKSVITAEENVWKSVSFVPLYLEAVVTYCLF